MTNIDTSQLGKFLERVRELLAASDETDISGSCVQLKALITRLEALELGLTADIAKGVEKWHDRYVELRELHRMWCGMGGAAPKAGDLPQNYPSADWDTFIEPSPTEIDRSSRTPHLSPSDDTVIPITDPPDRFREIAEDPLIRKEWWPVDHDQPEADLPLVPPQPLNLTKPA